MGLLLIHGFLSFAGEMRELAKILHRDGYSVMGVQLLGHHPPEFPDLHRYSHHDWLARAEEALDTLLEQTSLVVACGASMGGSVARFTWPAEKRSVVWLPLALHITWGRVVCGFSLSFRF